MDTGITISSDTSQPRVRRPLARSSDDVLARRVAGGGELAFAEIHRRYHAALYRYCRSLLRHEDDAQDALQATLLAAYRALREGRRDAPLRPWLFRIAHNESISLVRRRRPTGELSDAVPALAGVEESADVRARLRLLVGDLRALPERQRAALVLRELSGLSHEEIGHALQTTPAAAKQTIFEARRALAELQEGRAMSCEDICRTISDGDRRVLRGRRVRAHLRSCADCDAFARAISARTADLRALSPMLPPAAAALLLQRVLGSGARTSSGGSLTAGLTAKAVVGSALTKVAVVTTVVIAGGVAGYAQIATSARPQPAPLSTSTLHSRAAPRTAAGEAPASAGSRVAPGGSGNARFGHLAGHRSAAAPVQALRPGRGRGRRASPNRGAAAASVTSVGSGGAVASSRGRAARPRADTQGAPHRSNAGRATGRGRSVLHSHPTARSHAAAGNATRRHAAAPVRPRQASTSSRSGTRGSAVSATSSTRRLAATTSTPVLPSSANPSDITRAVTSTTKAAR